MLYEFLKENYQEGESIFFKDIAYNNLSRSAINQQLKKLCLEGKLEKYDNGIYYMPKKSKLKNNIGINADMVARYKYISKGGSAYGFYSGNTFANQLGILNQVPNKVEIVSNNVTAKIKEVSIGNRSFILRKPIVTITKDNVYVLQLLDLLKNLDAYLDESYEEAREKIKKYVETNNITKSEVDLYIREFPNTVFKNYYELRLDDVFTYNR